MNPAPNTLVRMFGCLHTLRKERGLSPLATTSPARKKTANDR